MQDWEKLETNRNNIFIYPKTNIHRVYVQFVNIYELSCEMFNIIIISSIVIIDIFPGSNRSGSFYDIYIWSISVPRPGAGGAQEGGLEQVQHEDDH
jgi:hypothetical protein